jgi:branched-chain amino acid transport system ATP-binding protein
MMTILRCVDVTQRFGELAAVRNISFEVEKGEIFGIAGPNGAGKTTLFNVITGFYRGSGDIFFDNERIIGLSTHQICHKGIARTFQIPHLFPTLPVAQNVRVGTHFGNPQEHNEKQDIEEVIRFVGLEGKENVPAESLSLLDKKLTMMAAALATKPKLFLLDEPIGGLSPTETKEFMTLVRKINQELGLTIMIIEHLMKPLTALSDRLMIMHNGEKVCLNPPKEVIADKKVIEIYLGSRYHA